MSLRLRKKPGAPSLQRRRQLEITVLAHNRVANHPLTEDERAQLTEVVYGYTGPCDGAAAAGGFSLAAGALPGEGRAGTALSSRAQAAPTVAVSKRSRSR